jgi:predicted ATPase/DNA-binding CsgD family transcriptional regulator
LLGRERELIEVQLRLLRDDVRLLTLTGAGGSGKTRLGVEAARTLAENFTAGVLFVDLSSLSQPGEVIPAVAGVLGIREAGDQSDLERLRRVLAVGERLLLLDNFEHLLAAAPQVVELIAGCPGLKILATSRAALRVRWEHEFVVRPLALPETAQISDVDALARVPSVALFSARASDASPDFQLGTDNAAAVAEICQRLDGLPLALELAASRTRLLPPQELARRLHMRLPTLSYGPRDLPARQQTLRASIDWSYQLLDSNERRVLQYLAVFVGGGQLDQVEQVCGGANQTDAAILDALYGLLEHNLVRREVMAAGEPRLRMLETIREFALDELQSSGEVEHIRRRHALAYVGLAETAQPELIGAGRMAWAKRLAADYDNLRTGLDWLLDHGEAELSCRLAGALTWWWYPLGRVRTGLDWTERALACAGIDDGVSSTRALFAAGVLAVMLGDLRLALRRLAECAMRCEQAGDEAGLADARIHLGIALASERPAEARALHEQALAVIRRTEDASWTAIALLSCGDRAFAAGELAEARVHFEESLALFRQTGDSMMAAQALNKLGDLARGSADHGRAAALYAESLGLMRGHAGDSGIPGVLHNLGYAAQHQAQYGEALARFGEAMLLFRATGDQRGVAECLLGMAAVALALGQPERAARLLGAADACLQTAGAAIAHANLIEYEHTRSAARTRLGRSAFATARQAGRAMSPEHAVAYASATAAEMSGAAGQQDRQPADSWLGLLTRREGAVAALLARGLSNRQIASELVITEQTVETHVKHLLSKLGLASRYQIQDWIDRYSRRSPD